MSGKEVYNTVPVHVLVMERKGKAQSIFSLLSGLSIYFIWLHVLRAGVFMDLEGKREGKYHWHGVVHNTQNWEFFGTTKQSII